MKTENRKIVVELYNLKNGAVVRRFLFTNREFDKFLKEFKAGRWLGVGWKYGKCKELGSYSVYRITKIFKLN